MLYLEATSNLRAVLNKIHEFIQAPVPAQLPGQVHASGPVPAQASAWIPAQVHASAPTPARLHKKKLFWG